MDVRGMAELIKKDIVKTNSYDRYPIRFFSVHYEEGIADKLIQLQSQIENAEIFDVKDLLANREDGWFSPDAFCKGICGLRTQKNYIVVGFSEYARFINEPKFVSMLLTLLEIENTSDNRKRRIYIPCFALYNQISSTIRKMHRRMEVYNPLMNETDGEDLPRVYFLKSGISAGVKNNELVHSKEWFGMWRNPDIKTNMPIICSSDTLAFYYKQASPDNVYNIRYLENYHDILKYVYGIAGLYPYKKNPDSFFKRLVDLVKGAAEASLNEIILSRLNTQNVDEKNFYYIWRVSDKFDRWLLQNYILKNSPEDAYLYQMMQSVEECSDSELIEKLYEHIFITKNEKHIAERIYILKTVYSLERDIAFSTKMETYYKSVLSEIIRKKTAVILNAVDFTKDEEALSGKQDAVSGAIAEEISPFLTYYSQFERRLIIWLYRMKLINGTTVEQIYPAFWIYLNKKDSMADPGEYKEKFDEYFDTYRKLRTAQNDTDEYNSLIGKWNHDEDAFYKWYSDLKIEYPEAYLKKRGFSGTVYVLDGVSAEFLNFIVQLLMDQGYTAEAIAYAKSHLPSITSAAKASYPGEYEKTWELEYDKKAVHGETYYPVNNMELALTLIEKIVNKIVEVEGDNNFALIADHGATVGHKIKKKDKKYNFEDAEHAGRCYLNQYKQYIVNSDDYIIYDDEAGLQWVIALNQQSLCDNSQYAVHGGATLEEVLVPVIIAKKGRAIATDFRIKAINLNVSGLQRDVEFEIIPAPTEEKVRLTANDGTDTVLTYKEETGTWFGKLKRGIEQDIEVAVAEQKYKFKTVPQTKMGDDLFDD